MTTPIPFTNSLTVILPKTVIGRIGKREYWLDNKIEIIEFAALASYYWGREAAKKWLMSALQTNEKTAIAMIRASKICLACAKVD